MYIHGFLLAVVVLRPCGFAIRSPITQTVHKKRCLHATFLKTENKSMAGPHHSVILPICQASNSITVLHVLIKKAVSRNGVKWLKHCL